MLLVVDEAQTALGRVGTMFAFEQHDVVPDFVALSKTLGGGLPLSATITSDAIEADAFEKGFLHVTSHVSDPLPAAVGRAVVRTVLAEDLGARAVAMGARLRAGLEELQRRHEPIGDVRGVGLMLGVDLVSDRETREPDAAYGSAVTERCLELGLNVNVIKFAGLGARAADRAAADDLDRGHRPRPRDPRPGAGRCAGVELDADATKPGATHVRHRRDDRHRARGRAGRARQRDRAAAGRVHPRPVAAAEQLGPLGDRLRGGRLHGADAGLARRPRDRRGGQRAPRGVRGQDRRPDRRPLRRDHPHARPQAGRHRPLLRRPADADPRRPRPREGLGGDRPGAVPRRAAAADLGAEGRQPGARQPGQPQPAPSRSPTTSSATRSRTPSARRRPRSCTRPTRSPPPAPRCSRPRPPTSTRGPRSRSTRRTPSAARC